MICATPLASLWSIVHSKDDLTMMWSCDLTRSCVDVHHLIVRAQQPSMSKLDLGKFPTTCINEVAQDVREQDGLGLASSAAPDELYRRLHSCNGRPHAP